eukprot:XP_004918431.1 PREDICTED: protein eva-1 homolog C-like [Xenopus tropicalis]
MGFYGLAHVSRCVSGCALGILYIAALGNLAWSSSEFSGYISRILKNYTLRACDGEYVSLRCPHRTTISIQSSFYGRTLPSHQMCPLQYPRSFETFIKEDVSCSSDTSLQVRALDPLINTYYCLFVWF